MLILDNNDIDIRPSTRRSNGGLRGIAFSLACYGSFGGLINSQTSNPQTTTNQQTTVQGGGDGSETATIGAQAGGGSRSNQQNITGGSGTTLALGAERGNNNTTDTTVNITSLDPEVALGAINAASNVAGYGIQAEGQTSANALQFGAEALDANASVTNNALSLGAESVGVSGDLANQAFNFGSEAVNTIANLAAYSVQAGQNETLAGQQESNQLQDTLGQIIANASPQTYAAQQELQSGTSPLGTGALSKLSNWLFVGAAGLSVYVFLKSKGRST